MHELVNPSPRFQMMACVVIILGISVFFTTYLPSQAKFDVPAVEEQRIDVDGSASTWSTAMWGNGTVFYTGGKSGNLASLIKWDSAGNIVWNQTWPGNSGVLTLWADESRLVTISENNYVQNLITWDHKGNVVWNKSLDSIANLHAHAVWGNGTDYYTSGSNKSVFKLVKWNSTGQIVWQRTNSSFNSGSRICGKGQYLFVVTEVDAWHFALLKWDSNGNLLWYHTYNLGVYSTDGWIASSIWIVENWIYMTISQQLYWDHITASDFLIKMDISGNLIWKKQIAPQYDIKITQGWGDETNTFTCGEYRDYIYIAKWDADGNVVWNVKFSEGNPTGAWGNSTTIYLSGQTSSGNNIFFLKISLQPFQWQRIVVPIVCGASLLTIVGYMLRKDRKWKKLQRAISTKRDESSNNFETMCAKCGASFVEGYKYCPFCGKML